MRIAIACLASLALVVVYFADARGASENTSKRVAGYVYGGTIGSRKVVVEFGQAGSFAATPVDNQQNAFSGRYFYRDIGLSIRLVCTRQPDGSISVAELGWNADRNLVPTGDNWTVRLEGDEISGIWHRRGGSDNLRISLQRLTYPARSSRKASNEQLSHYYIQLVDQPLVRGAQHIASPHRAYVTLTDERFQISGIEISRFPNTTVLSAANAVLVTEFNRRRSDASECLSDGPSDYSSNVRVATFSKVELSLDVRVSFYCGGPHPGEYFDPVTIDLRTGERVDWHRAISDPGAMLARYRKMGATRLEKDTSGCYSLYADDAWWRDTELEYEIVPSGLLMRADFPHMAAACEVDVILPTAAARAMLDPAFRALLSSQ